MRIFLYAIIPSMTVVEAEQRIEFNGTIGLNGHITTAPHDTISQLPLFTPELLPPLDPNLYPPVTIEINGRTVDFAYEQELRITGREFLYKRVSQLEHIIRLRMGTPEDEEQLQSWTRCMVLDNEDEVMDTVAGIFYDDFKKLTEKASKKKEQVFFPSIDPEIEEIEEDANEAHNMYVIYMLISRRILHKDVHRR